MGLRSFVAKRLTKFLLNHGNLDEQVQFLVEHTASCQEQVVVPLISYLTNKNNAQCNQFVEGLQLTTLHSITVWMASMIITFHLAKERAWRRKEIKLGSSSSTATYSSCGSSKNWWSSSWYCRLLSNAVNDTLYDTIHDTLPTMPFLLAIVSLSLATMLLLLPSLRSAENIDWMMMMMQYYPQLNSNKVVLWEKYLFVSSLWSILISVLMVLASLVWKALDMSYPRRVRETTSSSSSGSSINNNNNKSRTIKKKKKMTWRNGLVKAIANTRTTLLAISIIVTIPILSYIHLPLFRHALRNEIDYLDLFHLPPRVSTALHQFAWSFLSYCAFVKLLPREVPMMMTMANTNTTTMPEVGTRKVKKYITDPAVVQRMSALAKEARERVQARKDRKKRMLRRVHSESNFGNLTTTTTTATSSSMASSSSTSLSSSASYSTDPLTFQRPRSSSRSSTLASLPEHHEERKGEDVAGGNNVRRKGRRTPQRDRSNYSSQSPLRDIHMAGPTLSSSDLLAKLKNSRSIERSLSVSALADEEMSY